MQTRLRHSWEIRLFHWFLFIVILVKLWSGFAISFPHPLWGLSGMYSARMIHATMTSFLAALLTFRLYYSFLSGDWRELLIWQKSDFLQIRPWLRYFLFLDATPPKTSRKYQIGPRLLFTAFFLTMPVFYTTGVIMLNLPFFRWLNVFYGGLGIARVVHFLISVFLSVIVSVHIYLAVTSDLGRLKAMFSGKAPAEDSGVERGGEDEPGSTGRAGKHNHVR